MDTPLQAIRRHCLTCQGWNGEGYRPVKAVRQCHESGCEFYSFRLGRNAAMSRGSTRIRERLNKAVLDSVLFW